MSSRGAEEEEGACAVSRVASSWLTRLETSASWEKVGQGRHPSSSDTPDSSDLCLSADLWKSYELFIICMQDSWLVSCTDHNR